MELLAIVEENAAISALVFLAVGALQGAVLVRGIRNRFPSLKRHTRTVSAVLLVLFSVSAAANVAKFASPYKYDLVLPDSLTSEWLAESVSRLVGLDGGLISSSLVFVSVTLFIVFRAARLHAIARYFILVLSVATFGIFVLARFTDFVPSTLQVVMYASYQVGIAIGAFLVSRRREKPEDLFV